MRLFFTTTHRPPPPVKNPPANAGDTGSAGSSSPGSGRSPGGGNGNPLPVFLSWKPMDRGAWWARAWGYKQLDSTEPVEQWLYKAALVAMVTNSSASLKGIAFSDLLLISKNKIKTFFRKSYRIHLPFALTLAICPDSVNSGNLSLSGEKAMAPHCSILAWKIPWMEEPGGLQSMGSRRVRHNWGTSLSLFTFMHCRRKWQPTPVFLPGESQGRGSLVSCRLWGRTESDTTEVT